MIDWSTIHIDWSDVHTIHQLVHIPTNTALVVDTVDTGQREALRAQLDALVPK